MMKFAWVIPVIPLLSFVIQICFGRRLQAFSAHLAIMLMRITFVLSLLVMVERFFNQTVSGEFEWLRNGFSSFTLGFEVNPLNTLMLTIVSFVSLLVHTYSKGYMKNDERFSVFYAYLGLFTFAMLGLVISPNLLQMYIFWELVGLGSFLLIGFYFNKDSARKAAKKAFIMTRIGDVGFLTGILLIFSKTGTFHISEIFYQVEHDGISQTAITAAAILIFIGAMGKSGQFPLHTWLPDAMEGPTPVSALIHAATMVAAGVYLVATMFPLFAASKAAMLVVAIVGGITAIFAASIGIVQKDIKGVLAFSTVSQLGYMMLALGSAGYVAGVFHLATHAVFKALLFLAAGSVIHAMHTQNIDLMGGLWKRMKLTGSLFLIGTLAIAGVPLLSGFFSKEEILVAVWHSDQPVLFWLAIVTAFLTSFYMFRLFFMVFWGQERSDIKHVRESSEWMTWPMVILGFFAVVLGFVNTPWFGTWLGNWLVNDQKFLAQVGVQARLDAPAWIMALAVTMTVLGFLLAWALYVKQIPSLQKMFQRKGTVYQVLLNQYYVDGLYAVTVLPALKSFSVVLSLVDLLLVRGTMKLLVGVVKGASALLARLQSGGQVQNYGAWMIFGLAIILVVFLITGGYVK